MSRTNRVHQNDASGCLDAGPAVRLVDENAGRFELLPAPRRRNGPVPRRRLRSHGPREREPELRVRFLEKRHARPVLRRLRRQVFGEPVRQPREMRVRRGTPRLRVRRPVLRRRLRNPCRNE